MSQTRGANSISKAQKEAKTVQIVRVLIDREQKNQGNELSLVASEYDSEPDTSTNEAEAFNDFRSRKNSRFPVVQ